jgi:hypothetical protein
MKGVNPRFLSLFSNQRVIISAELGHQQLAFKKASQFRKRPHKGMDAKTISIEQRQKS